MPSRIETLIEQIIEELGPDYATDPPRNRLHQLVLELGEQSNALIVATEESRRTNPAWHLVRGSWRQQDRDTYTIPAEVVTRAEAIADGGDDRR